MWRRKDFPYRKHFVKHKCIFVHIPKAAGTSVLAALGKTQEKGRDHISWQTYKKCSSRKFNAYFKFSFVRNPYDRALSAYRYILSGGNQGAQDLSVAQEIAQYSSFDDFVERALWKGAFRSHLLFLPQSSFIMDANEVLMVDFLGYFETLEEDFKFIAETLGIESQVAHHNKGNTPASAGNVDMATSTREKLAIMYAQDFVNFGYTP
ncbi:sulfotransferase family 2 domain-containing protein [Cobetia sp. L2A1]|uniref:sulfotransferase family 2 domain-containing protein n=1 Tax=Cobetia sp. L2A1 TaxID=2686360 RepID=UPI00131AFD35|nr:sulfotransferase family 2 domain-containing protein [Cobetia sp. L2A1]